MWLAIKLAGDKLGEPSELPDLGLLIKQFGNQSDAVLYRNLLAKNPKVTRGHEEDLDRHFARLKAADQKRQEQNTRPSGMSNPFTREVKDVTPEWKLYRDRDEAAAKPAPTDLGGMPQRIPGWYTGDTELGLKPPPGYKPPNLLPRRGPSQAEPYYDAPAPPSIDEWTKSLGDKGIFLDNNGQRLQQRTPYPHGPIDSRDNWGQFIDYGRQPDPDDAALRSMPQDQGGLGRSWKQRAKDLFGGRRASTEVTDYFKHVMAAVEETS